MLTFPQLSTSASVQYPIAKRVSRRAVQSVMEDGTAISLADASASYERWKLTFRELSDQEASSVSSFFSTASGCLMPFLFLDPTTNLLSWSSDLTQSAWQQGSLAVESTFSDPLGGKSAFRITNTAGNAVSIAQSTQIAGSLQTCLSVYLRADTPVNVTMFRSAGAASCSKLIPVTPQWARYSLSNTFPAVTDVSTYSLSIPSLGSVNMFGPQVDGQLIPAVYIPTTSGCGIHVNARFDMDELTITATGPNRNACDIYIRTNGA
jgi:hypothetical protein